MVSKLSFLARKNNYFCSSIYSSEIMRYKKGDRVNFLNDTGGGTVIRYDDQGLVFVLTEDGFEIPVAEKELVPSGKFALNREEDEPEVKKQAIKPEEPKVPPIAEKIKIPALPGNVPADAPVHVLLGFIADNPGPIFASNLALYLVNDSPYFAYYVLGEKTAGVLHYLTSGLIEADTKNYIATFDQTAISKISDIHFQMLFISKGRYGKKAPLDQLISLNLVNFSKESFYRENDYFNEKAVLFSITEEETEDSSDEITVPDEMIALKNDADIAHESKQKKKEVDTNTLEVDLHLDEITLKNSQLMPSAMLALQMSRFHAAIEEAISKNMRRLVVIHGLGQGTLKMQIRKELQEKYPQYLYQDASFKEYGFGATMVHLIHN
jgi:hypothetical protein